MSKNKRGRESKVSRLINKYELQGTGRELERLWTTENDRLSLRELETHFNKQLLGEVLKKENVQALEGEIENTYHLLTDESINEADQTRIRRRLKREGVDVDDLLDDFVTYQAIRTYLTKQRGVEYTPIDTDPVEREVKNVRQLQGRVAAVTEGKTKQLYKSDHITLGDFRTIVDVQIVCTDCNSQFKAIELFERRGCNCMK